MKVILVLCAAVFVAGCSSAPMRSADNGNNLRCDYAQMDKVEAQAKVLRTELRWVNCPQAHDSVKS